MTMMMSSSKVVFTTAALRLEHALARRATSSSSCGFIVRRHLSAAPNAPKKKSKKTDKPTTPALVSLSYTDRKQAAKQERTQAYIQKLEKVVERQHRRDDAPKHVMKSAFKEWYDARRAWETQMDRKARQSNKEWKIQVAVVLERIPVVLPDQEEWEVDYDELYTYLAQFGKEYPPEFAGSRTNRDAPVAITDEELLALLPEGFRPAPRETTADETGNLQTHERKLKDRVFLMIQNTSENNKWYFPTTPVQDDESLLEAAQRALKEQATGGSSGKKKEVDHVFDIYCPSNAPIGVSLDVFNDNDGDDGNYFGTKTFFLKVQHDEGDIQSKDILKQGVNDFAWLDRSEIVERAQGDDDLSKFYHYLL